VKGGALVRSFSVRIGLAASCGLDIPPVTYATNEDYTHVIIIDKCVVGCMWKEEKQKVKVKYKLSQPLTSFLSCTPNIRSN
jgi:hypothetical protein